MQRHDDGRVAFRFRRVPAFARPARQRDAQNRLRHLVLFDELFGELLQFLRRERRFDFQKIRAARHAFQMLGQTERPAVHDAHGLKQPVAIHETAVVDRNDSFGFGHKMAIEKNGHVFLMPSN